MMKQFRIVGAIVLVGALVGSCGAMNKKQEAQGYVAKMLDRFNEKKRRVGELELQLREANILYQQQELEQTKHIDELQRQLEDQENEFGTTSSKLRDELETTREELEKTKLISQSVGALEQIVFGTSNGSEPGERQEVLVEKIKELVQKETDLAGRIKELEDTCVEKENKFKDLDTEYKELIVKLENTQKELDETVVLMQTGLDQMID